MKNILRKEKGITLVALIITIIVLLILAVVTIAAIRGDHIINHAENARDSYAAGRTAEEDRISSYEAKLEQHVPGSSTESGSQSESGSESGSQSENDSTVAGTSHSGIIPVGGTYKIKDGETLIGDGATVAFPDTIIARRYL